jgi:hypothetical protein
MVSLLTAIAVTNDFTALQVAVEWLRKIQIILLVLSSSSFTCSAPPINPSSPLISAPNAARATVLPVKIEQAKTPRE